MVVGTVLQASATESVQLIIARIVTGIGNGINTVNVPVWQAESFKSHNRGVGVYIPLIMKVFDDSTNRHFSSFRAR